MKFHCDSCSQDKDFFGNFKMSIIDAKGNYLRYCRSCCNPKMFVPDVYWDGKPEEGLADDMRTGKPITFGSALEKARYLQAKGLQEGGDRVHGAMQDFSRREPPKVDSTHEIKMALKKVREMGIDNRRQEYLRITKQGQKHSNI